MSANERVFNILELCCFPKGCAIDKGSQPYLATVIVPKLEAAGMKTAEWTRGALMLEAPHFSRVKSIVCRGCMHFECAHNATARSGRSDEILDDITECGFAERRETNAKLVEAILPQKSVEEWVAQGMVIGTPFVMSSRTRFYVSFDVVHPNKSKTTITTRRKKGEQGEIQVYGQDPSVYPLPRTAAEASLKLHEIINNMI